MDYSLEIEGLVAHKHKLEAEIERLRAALARIVVDGTDDAKTRNDCAEIARLALVGPTGKD